MRSVTSYMILYAAVGRGCLSHEDNRAIRCRVRDRFHDDKPRAPPSAVELNLSTTHSIN